MVSLFLRLVGLGLASKVVKLLRQCCCVVVAEFLHLDVEFRFVVNIVVPQLLHLLVKLGFLSRIIIAKFLHLSIKVLFNTCIVLAQFADRSLVPLVLFFLLILQCLFMKVTCSFLVCL